jgi:long-chain acyl-CoA synthetase
MAHTTLSGYLNDLADQCADQIWLRDRKGDEFTEWSWSDAHAEVNAAAAWLEKRYGASQANIALLSRNRAHWMLADLAIIASGNVTIPMFTTLATSTAEYILDFTEARALILGEAENWAEVSKVLPDGVDVITLPGVEIDAPHTRWQDILSECAGQAPEYTCKHDDLISLVFTSGTTGVPKGVMQTHDSFLIPMQSAGSYFRLKTHIRFLSYLPLSHIAERQLVLVQSMLYVGSVTFNEALTTLVRDMADVKPDYFFGAPRVWEQLQQGVIAKFGSPAALDAALASNPEAVGKQVRSSLGLSQEAYLLTAAAPTPPALIEWYGTLGLTLMEGFGQTEIMATAINTPERRKIGSIGHLVDGVEMKFTEEGEMCFKSDGAAIGYYKMPGKTAETFVDGWVHTGDKAYVDDDGFIFLTGRVKDYFKTIQGKFVAPVPIESIFAENEWTEQSCLLGRGYSKTAMVCVLSEIAQKQERSVVENALREKVEEVNASVDKHARIGAVIVSTEPWTIENEILTPTLKIRRDEVEGRFGDRARELAHEAAVGGRICVDWCRL